VGLALCAIAGFWFVGSFRRRISALPFFSLAMATGCLVAFALAPLGTNTWLGFHALLVATLVTGWLMLGASMAAPRLGVSEVGPFSNDAGARLRQYIADNFQVSAVRLATLSGLITVLLALRSSGDDPGGYAWAIGAFVATGCLAAALNWATLSALYLYISGALFCVAASIWWFRVYSPQALDAGADVSGFLYVNAITLALPSVIWLVFALRARRIERSNQTAVRKGEILPSFHHVAAILAVCLVALPVAIGLLRDLSGFPFDQFSRLGWAALFAVIVAVTANLFDRKAAYAVAGIYALGLLALLMALDALNLYPRHVLWTGMIFFALYTVATSFAWRSRQAIARKAESWKIPRHEIVETRPVWLHFANAILSALVLIVAYWVVLSFDHFALRLLAALAVTAQVLSFGMVAEGAWRARWQKAALAFFSIGIVFCFWSSLVPGSSGTWLNRAVLVMIAMLALIAADGFGSIRIFRGNETWIKAARSLVPYLAGAGAFALLFVLATEVDYQNRFGAVRINLFSLVTVALTLLSATVVFITFAVSPSRDPLKLDEHGRMRYVYVAEAMLALLFVHIRLTMPWLFTGFFSQYWPLVVVGIAFLGVGISETLRRQGISVLAEPIERTGAFLPLLPVLGYWVVSSRVDYSMVLFAIGLLYAALSILRRSFAFGLLAALAGNGGLWHLLNHTDSFRFSQHPQLWLIPFALSVLVAAHINRDRFTEEQMATIRYVTLMLIYVSSTADIFISGVAQSPWLPLVLAALSLVGVFCGISLRIRAFLFLGSIFLLIAVITMIWYASANLGWTWLWYVAGIMTGGLIIFTFALFEKKRTEMLRVVEGLREWQR
jgi:hypothetical protein